ncbi:hypothetical protein [Paraburkholderia unamae]|uniref:Response regulatory domain-containing protein n=1 Tax=Paraburkholderia unamae TaxID=219649 RepID=A0ABX5KF58_9BURK|nr:hypothetical protein [Paraburkholderia unamae]PVX72827.1 hypothetical protein C7402_12366 [Paraburkholderia unamae]RAR54216.1 hypothetical protein C7401_12547 [Paraburkholderia unamae]CAG9272560.1 Response regulator receiver domain-containing protein [Paraburkholderia unamae]
MKIAILESDVDKLDKTLETLSASGHLCFGVRSDEGVRRVLDDVSVDLFLIDWTDPDGVRYDTLTHLSQCAPGVPVVLCVAPHTPDSVVNSGIKCGASLALEKPLRGIDSLNSLHTLSRDGFASVFAAGTHVM